MSSQSCPGERVAIAIAWLPAAHMVGSMTVLLPLVPSTTLWPLLRALVAVRSGNRTSIMCTVRM